MVVVVMSFMRIVLWENMFSRWSLLSSGYVLWEVIITGNMATKRLF